MNFNFSLGNGIAIKFGEKTILLDPKVSDFVSFVSHAHSDHYPKDLISKPICTEETAELVKIRNPNFEAEVAKENKRIKFDNFSVKLINSGHVLGSTQTFVEVDGTSILYTGDFKLSQGLTSEKIRIQEADVLITEATYGHPSYRFPPIEKVREDIIKWVRENLRKNQKVNIGGYEIGKSEEAIKLLNQNGIIPHVSSTIKRFCEVYNKFGWDLKFIENGEEADVSVRPMYMIKQMKARKNVRSCVLTGWSLLKNFGEKGFPLSDHSDFNQIIEFVKRVNPKKVYTVHGYEKELASYIRKNLKIDAEPLVNSKQKKLFDF